jgi:hypothetical protein
MSGSDTRPVLLLLGAIGSAGPLTTPGRSHAAGNAAGVAALPQLRDGCARHGAPGGSAAVGVTVVTLGDAAAAVLRPPLDAIWPAGLCIMAAWSLARADERAMRRDDRRWPVPLMVLMIATAGLSALMLGWCLAG